MTGTGPPRRQVTAVLLPDTATSAGIDALRRSLSVPEPFVIPAHLTLVGPRPVADDDLGEVRAVLHAAAAASAPFEVSLGPVATFAPDRTTLHLAARATGRGPDPISALRRALHTGPLEGSDPWPFVPHVTLAHPCARLRTDAATGVLAAARWDFTARSVHLLERTGARWTPTIEAPLGPPPRVELADGTGLSVYERHRLDERYRVLASAVPAAPAGAGDLLCVSFEADGGHPVALAHGRTGPIAELQSVVVDPHHRGRRLGTAVLEHWLAAARRHGADAVMAAPSASSAHSWLVARGFVDAGWPWLRAR